MSDNLPPTWNTFSNWAEEAWKARRAGGQRNEEDVVEPIKSTGNGGIGMERMEAGEPQRRVSKWLEEGQSLLAPLEALFAENEQLRARADASEQECEKLRQEAAGIQRERDELFAELSKVMTEILHPVNEIVQKIRGKQGKSPFKREAPPSQEA